MGKQILLWAWRDLRGSLRHFRLVFLCLVISITAITAVQVTGGSILQSIEANGRTILGGDWVMRQLYVPMGEAERQWLQERGAILADTVELRVMMLNPTGEESALIELKAVGQDYPLYGEATTSISGQPFSDTLARGVVLERSLGERLGVGLNEIVRLGEQEFSVAAWLENEPDNGRGIGFAPRAFISRSDLATTGLEQPGSMVYYDLRVRWPETRNIKSLEKEFSAAFPDGTWRLTTIDRAAPRIQRFVDNLVQFLTLIGFSALLIGGIGIANGMRAYLQTRLNSIAIFKAIGMPTGIIRRIYLLQIAGIGLVGTACGVLVGCLLPYGFMPLLEGFLPFPLEIHFTFARIIIPLVFGVLTTGVFALWPHWVRRNVFRRLSCSVRSRL